VLTENLPDPDEANESTALSDSDSDSEAVPMVSAVSIPGELWQLKRDTLPGQGPVCFSPDSRQLCVVYRSADRSQQLELLFRKIELSSGRSINHIVPTRFQCVSLFACTEDLSLLACAHVHLGKSAYLRVSTLGPSFIPTVFRTLSTEAAVTSMFFTPDHRVLVCSCLDSWDISMWQLSTGAQLKILPAIDGMLMSIRPSDDGSLFLSTYSNGTLRVWNPSIGVESSGLDSSFVLGPKKASRWKQLRIVIRAIRALRARFLHR
jgi:WD40 repeat protein